jgi:murein DD-endopeptidase MepM/ murein hydrolase activator NlpD
MTTQPDPFLDAFTSAKGATVDPNIVASQIENLLHIVSGRPLPETSPAALIQGAGPTAEQTPSAAPNLGSSDHAAPVEGGNMPINSGFGPRGQGMHEGVDIGVPVGSHMIAAISGTVTRAVDEPGGYGNLIEITGPNGISVRYGHLSQIGVQAGQTVTAGQSIGVSGGAKGAPGAGNSEGPHLHFEVRQNGQAVDPSAFLAGGAAIVGAAPSAGSTDAQPVPLSPEALVDAQVQNTLDVLAGKEPTAETTSTTPTQTKTGQAGDMYGQILAGIGAPDTPENRKLMDAWARAEGMDPTANNPFATTWDTPTGDTSINAPGVRRYETPQLGVEATVNTLRNYPGIVAALKASNAMAAADAIAASPWGTGGLVKKILGGG